MSRDSDDDGGPSWLNTFESLEIDVPLATLVFHMQAIIAALAQKTVYITPCLHRPMCGGISLNSHIYEAIKGREIGIDIAVHHLQQSNQRDDSMYPDETRL